MTRRGRDVGDPEYRRIAVALFAAGFATFALVFDAQAALPAIGAAFEVPSATAALTVSATTLGLAASVLPWSWVADRAGRLVAMRVSLAAALLVSFGQLAAVELWQVIAVRALLGVALGAVPGVAMAYLAEELAPARVSIAAGVFVAGNTVGGIVGRIVAGLASAEWGWRAGFALVSLIAVAMAAWFLLAAPSPRGFVPRPVPARLVWARALFQVRDPTMLALYAQGLFLMGSFGAVYNYLGFRLMAAPFGLPATWASLVFTAYLAGTAASRWCGILARRWGHLRVMLAGIGTMVCGAVMMVGPWLWLVLTGLVVFTVGCFTAHPLASGLTGQRAQVGRAQGSALYQLSWLGGTALFGWLGGVCYDRWGWAATVAMVAALCLAAAASAIAGLHLLSRRRPAPARHLAELVVQD
ncbi:MFS transporter [Propionicicella superfundia]|uniref:MFS transporter n=1 Tax=Propionicicella superfundia TaxID=348582 RepID=UPI000401447C|nr:MFS transporter [Propionicicella superfundia]